MFSFNHSANEKNYSFLIENTSNKSVPLRAGVCRELWWSKEGVLWGFLVVHVFNESQYRNPASPLFNSKDLNTSLWDIQDLILNLLHLCKFCELDFMTVFPFQMQQFRLNRTNFNSRGTTQMIQVSTTHTLDALSTEQASVGRKLGFYLTASIFNLLCNISLCMVLILFCLTRFSLGPCWGIIIFVDFFF